jgi:excisionase family DNA binding protein
MTQEAASYASQVVARATGGSPMTLEEVGEALRLSAKTVKREIQRGRLICARIGGRLVVYPKDLTAYLTKARKES